MTEPLEARIHVLLVEDDARPLTLTREYLETHGLVVATAARGDSGLEEALAAGVDVIVLAGMLLVVDMSTLAKRGH